MLPGADELVSLQDQNPQVSLVYDPKLWRTADSVLLDAQRSLPQPVFEE
jgi:hypothetical protein